MSYMDAILANRPGAQCVVNEDTGEIMDWNGPGDKPTVEELSSWAASYSPPAPASITMRQCRLHLLSLGKLDDVKAAMAQAPESEKIEWEYATAVHRDNPIVASLMALLGADAHATDDFFRAASLL